MLVNILGYVLLYGPVLALVVLVLWLAVGNWKQSVLAVFAMSGAVAIFIGLIRLAALGSYLAELS